MLKKILKSLNFFEQCRRYNIPLWQCPQFLFLIMGILIIASAISAYVIGNRYINDPLMVAFIVLVFAALLFSIAFIIVRSFEGLAEANRMKSEFISVATHQLRSPLSILKWVIELLMSGKLGKIEEKQIEYFAILRENINKMKELISNLLTISRLEASKLPIKKKYFDIEKLIRDLITEYQSFTAASNVEIFFEAEKSLPQVYSDPLQLKLVIENLLDNAIRYIKRGGKIEIKVKRKNKHIYFSIKDNGVGIPKKDQKYIFRKFFRSENVLRYQTKGAGLGLYISKMILKGLGGKIGFKSKENEGSTFWFILPIKS